MSQGAIFTLRLASRCWLSSSINSPEAAGADCAAARGIEGPEYWPCSGRLSDGVRWRTPCAVDWPCSSCALWLSLGARATATPPHPQPGLPKDQMVAEEVAAAVPGCS